MEKYQAKDERYEVFSANMTMDTNSGKYLRSDISACKSCQCNCRLCLGGMAPEVSEVTCEKDAENALEMLLAA